MDADLLLSNAAAHWMQSGILAVTVLLGIRVLKLRQPRVKLAVLQIATALLFVLPWVQPWRPAAGIAPADAATAPFVVEGGVDAAQPAVDTSSGRPARGHDLAPLVLVVMTLGAVGRLTWIAAGLVRMRWFAAQATPVDLPLFADDLARATGVEAECLEHPDAAGPAAFGLMRPRIFLPIRFRELPPARQRAVICHELLHVKRRDPAVGLIEELAVALLWFHPWIWLLRSELRLAREQVVDAGVLAVVGDRAEYVHCLVEMAGHNLAPLFSPAGARMVRPRELRARVDAMFQEAVMSRRRMAALCAALVLIALGAIWLGSSQAPIYAMTMPQRERPDVTAPHASGPVIRRTAAARQQPEGSVSAALAARPAAPALQAPGSAADRPRRLVRGTHPEYPAEALEKQIGGVVTVNIAVNAAGDVTTADVASGPDVLRASAFKAAMGLKTSAASGTTAMTIAFEYRVDQQSWGVRLIDGPGTALQELASTMRTLRGMVQNGGAGARRGPNGEYPHRRGYPRTPKDRGYGTGLPRGGEERGRAGRSHSGGHDQ